MAAEQVTYNGPDGATVRSSASELVSFHGVTPVAQAAIATAVVTGVTAGAASSADFLTLTTTINAIRTLLINKGLMASS